MKNCSKICAVLLSVITLFSLAACNMDSGANADAIDIGVAIYKFDDNFMTLYRNALEDYVEQLDGGSNTYRVTIVDGKGDQAEQTNQIDTFIANQVDVIICNLVQASSAATVIQKCKAANIPVVFINREPTEEDLALWDRVSYVGADARQSGKFQGEIIAETETKGDINQDGVVSYVMITGDPENVDAQYRTEYSIKALKDAGIQTQELFNQRGDWAQEKGQELAATALANFGEKIDVIFCNNDAMALGASQAIAAAGRTVGKDIYLVGVDALEEAQSLVESGKMTGTVLNDHAAQAKKAVDVALQAVSGEPIEKNYTIDYVKITK